MLPTAVLLWRPAGVRLRALFVIVCFLLAASGAEMAVAQQQPAVTQADSTVFSAAGIGTGTRAIAGLWQFHLGDDPAWAQPTFDDHTWEQLPADGPWGDAGHPGYWGYSWYRRQITLDPNSKEPLALLLPPLASVAEVYWNGVEVGGIGTPPPHAAWPNIPAPVAVPLHSAPGASAGELAIRVWEHRLTSVDAQDAGGFQAAPQLGYRPLIEKMPQQWTEHLFRVHAVANASHLLLLFMAIAALVLWTRSRSQWLLLAVAGYLGTEALSALSKRLPITYVPGQVLFTICSSLCDIALVCVVLLIADLPSRAGVRGARFWWRASFAILAIDSFGFAETICQLFLWNSRLFHFLDISSEFTSYAYTLFVPVLLVVCFVLSRLTLPRLLFLAAVALDTALTLFTGLLVQQTTRMDWLLALVQHPVLRIYGSNLSIFTADRILILLAIVYAVSDRLGQQVARQRFVDAEMRAAQEIQQVLVPAAAERQAPGYAVQSVYRPASEVGGDFFQIIPLQQGDGTLGTLIVAGDVSGKGLRAAMTVSLVVGTLRTLAEYDPSPAAVLAGLNRRLLGRTQGGFVTCCTVRIDAGGRATMANAGHCHPYLDGREVELPNGLPLGILEDAEYEEMAVDVSHGQQLTLLSDGVVEARNHHGELYGFDRLNELMQKRPTAEHVADTAVGFGQEDDITVLTVTRLATA